MKGYCTIEDTENYLLTEIDLSFVGQVEAWIEAQEAYIDQETGRNFIADAESNDRFFDGDGESEMFIDDCVGIEKVTIDDVDVSAKIYSYPANKFPMTKIVLADGKFTRGKQNVVITAFWGYSPECPADIKMACTVLVAGIINNQTVQQSGEVQSMTMGRYQVTYRSKKEWQDFEGIKTTLAKYQRLDV